MTNQDHDMDGSAFSLPGDDAWLESMLRADAAQQPHIVDDGFSARVMQRLPASRQSAPRWIVPAATVFGSAVAVGLTPVGSYFVQNLLGLLDVRHFSMTHLTVLVPIAVFYACSFAAARER